jgi:hypothetical protein
LPQISILKENGLKEMLLTIDISNSKSENFDTMLAQKIKSFFNN